jgi:hypothetical protein
MTGLLIIVLSVIMSACAASLLDSTATTLILDRGHQKLTSLSKLSEHSQCFQNALARLESNCQHMNEEQRRRLALNLLECHLDNSGRADLNCFDDDLRTVRQCTSTMDSQAFALYTSFFIDVDHICFFLAQEAWLARVQNVVGALEMTSNSVALELTRMENKTRLIAHTVAQLEHAHHMLMDGLREASADMFYVSAFIAGEQRLCSCLHTVIDTFLSRVCSVRDDDAACGARCARAKLVLTRTRTLRRALALLRRVDVEAHCLVRALFSGDRAHRCCGVLCGVLADRSAARTS